MSAGRGTCEAGYLAVFIACITIVVVSLLGPKVTTAVADHTPDLTGAVQ